MEFFVSNYMVKIIFLQLLIHFGARLTNYHLQILWFHENTKQKPSFPIRFILEWIIQHFQSTATKSLAWNLQKRRKKQKTKNRERKKQNNSEHRITAHFICWRQTMFVHSTLKSLSSQYNAFYWDHLLFIAFCWQSKQHRHFV